MAARGCAASITCCETNLPAVVAGDPLTCVVRGGGRMLDELMLLTTVAIAS